VVIAGGGLHGCVAALALAAVRPGARVAVIERAAELGGNHTWCLHAGDVPPGLAPVIAPAIAHRWDGYSVAFADHARALASPYAAVTSRSLAAAVRTACAGRPGFAIVTGRAVREIRGDAVVLDDGRLVRGARVIDARGPERYAGGAAGHGYQKFVGLELTLARPHGLTRPVVMDARVPQTDGFRFVYVLPLAPDRLLVEDTYFSDAPELDRDAIACEVLAYAARHGLAVEGIARIEAGVLPLPLEPTFAPDPGDGPRVAGYQGGWFHPTTGYSFPVALRVAERIARAHEPGAAEAWAALVADHARQIEFATRLNRLLFRWFPPAQRHHVLSRFYRLPESTIRRFYAMSTTRLDRARIFIGRPPRGLSWRAALTGRNAA
jgi:lycopene beta-cyclase